MKGNNRFVLLCVVLLMAHLSVVAQDFLWVNGEGQLVDNAYMINNLPTEIRPKVKHNTKSVIVNQYLLVNRMGKLHRWADRDSQYIMHYDTLGRLVQIQGSQDDYVGVNFIYENGKVVEVDGNYGCSFTYDENGRLKTMQNMYGDIYQYTLDKNGNITKINKYHGSKFICTYTCNFDKKSRKFMYNLVNGNEKMDIVMYFNNAGDVSTIMAYREFKWISGRVDYEHNEFRFEYDSDGNPIRCIKTEIGDIAVETKGYEYEYTYEFYPTETEEEIER